MPAPNSQQPIIFEMDREMLQSGASPFQTALEAMSGSVLSAHPDPLRVLWQNGLLGYELPDEKAPYSHFHVTDDANLYMPGDATSYVFHPVLGHAVSIDPIGQRPAIGFATRRASER